MARPRPGCSYLAFCDRVLERVPVGDLVEERVAVAERVPEGVGDGVGGFDRVGVTVSDDVAAELGLRESDAEDDPLAEPLDDDDGEVVPVPVRVEVRLRVLDTVALGDTVPVVVEDGDARGVTAALGLRLNDTEADTLTEAVSDGEPLDVALLVVVVVLVAVAVAVAV